METAQQQAERLNRLVGDLLDLSRIEAGAVQIKLEPCDVEDIIGAALARSDYGLSGREVEVNVPPALPYVRADAGLVTHALVNILDNAAKYSPDNTPIQISACQIGQTVEISVGDRGKGLSTVDLPKLFERFYRSETQKGRGSAVDGMGLGLFICRGLVEAQGGQVWAANRPDGGAMFTVSMPIFTVETGG